MPLDVAFQMDHIAGLAIAGDSTFALMLEGQRRGHRNLPLHPGSPGHARRPGFRAYREGDGSR